MLWLLAIPVAYLALLAWIVHLSLHPKRVPYFMSPGILGAPQEDVEFHTDDGVRLRGWWIEAKDPVAIAVLPHGYLMNASEMTPIAFQLWQKGCSCLVFDFRAHGRSGSRKTGLGWLERHDVISAVRWSRARHPGLPLFLVGSSMGAAASVFAQAEQPGLADALVLDSAYSTLDQAVLGWWRFLGGRGLMIAFAPTILLSRLFIRYRPKDIDVAQALAKIADVPVLIAHGDADDLALPAAAERNLANCGPRGRIEWFVQCGHSEGRLRHPGRYMDVLTRFLRDHGLLPSPIKAPLP